MSQHPQSEFERYTDSECRAMLIRMVHALHDRRTRDNALRVLANVYKQSHNKVFHEEMAPMLWHSFGTIAVLLQVVISVYNSLSSPRLPEVVLNRVCNVLALLQSIATHPDTKVLFLRANIPMYLQPILNNKIQENHHQYIRIGSLGVIGGLVKDDDPAAIHFILKSEMFPCFLNCMEIGSAYEKTVSVFVIRKILMDNEGIKYCCAPAGRFFTLGRSLANLIEELAEAGRLVDNNSKRMLKHIIGCYHRISSNPRACDGLRCCLPPQLRDASFISILRDDEETMQCLLQLLDNIESTQLARLHRHGQSGRHLGA